MKHYVISYEYAFTARISPEEKLPEVSSGTAIIGVTHTRRGARKILAKAANQVRPNVITNGWQIHYDNGDAFVAGNDENYNDEHLSFYVEKVVNKINSTIF